MSDIYGAPCTPTDFVKAQKELAEKNSWAQQKKVCGIVEQQYLIHCTTHDLVCTRDLVGKPEVCPECFGPLGSKGCSVTKQ